MKLYISNFASSKLTKMTNLMKKFLALIIVVFTTCITSFADETSSNSTPKNIGLQYSIKSNGSSIHRAPMRINVDAYYDAATNTIEISYNGEDDGEVFLYLNDNLIDYDCQINTTFQLPATSGLYCIEIVTESWTARGYIQL